MNVPVSLRCGNKIVSLFFGYCFLGNTEEGVVYFESPGEPSPDGGAPPYGDVIPNFSPSLSGSGDNLLGLKCVCVFVAKKFNAL